MKIKYPMVWDIAYNNCNTHYDPILKRDIETPPDWSVPIVPYPDGVICKASEWVEDFTFNSNWRKGNSSRSVSFLSRGAVVWFAGSIIHGCNQ